MRKIVPFFVAILVIAMAVSGCSKATATGPSIVLEPTATVTETRVELATATATSTETATVDLTTVLTPSTPTSTATTVGTIPTVVQTATPVSQMLIGWRITSVSGNTSGTVDVVGTCGAWSISRTAEPVGNLTDESITAWSNHILSMTVTPGTPGAIVMLELTYDGMVVDVRTTTGLPNDAIIVNQPLSYWQ